METVVDTRNSEPIATEAEPVVKTSANRLLFAPPKFTPTPYE